MRLAWPLLVASAVLAVSTAFAVGWPRRPATDRGDGDVVPPVETQAPRTAVASSAAPPSAPVTPPPIVPSAAAASPSRITSSTAPVPAPTAAPALAQPPPASSSVPTWRELAARGDAPQAYAALGPDGVARRSQSASVEDLFALADIARLSGHASEAVAPLDSILSEHPTDPRAPLAALTLGRIQMKSLAAPAAAAKSVERALALGLPESIAEDAYGLLVESLSRAGDEEGARAAYSRWVARFPRSERAAELRAALGRPLGPQVAPR